MARIAWVTGGASGIGAAVVRRLLDLGETVAVLDVAPPVPEAIWCRVDLSEPEATNHGIDELRARVGWPERLILCAGIPGVNHPVAQHPLDTWHHVLTVNLTGPFLVLRRAIGPMCDRRFGRIVTVSSGNALRPAAGAAGYAASKAALIALTKAVAIESAEFGVTANVVAPGITNTPMARQTLGGAARLREVASQSAISNPQKRVLEPEEIADAIFYLCSDGSGRVTGQTFHVNGGSLMP